MSRTAVDVVLDEQERVALERIVNAQTSEQRMVVRARVVLRAQPCVARWSGRSRCARAPRALAHPRPHLRRLSLIHI